MGHDGVEGLARLRKRGWTTFAQDEASSVVYGMPRAAVERGAAEETLPLGSIGPALARAVARRSHA
jgi:chemotaxis response regulator CheB